MPPWLRRAGALVCVVALTFVKIFPFSSQIFGALGALVFGALASDGRLRRWFGSGGGWGPTLAWGAAGGLAVFGGDAVLFGVFPLLHIVPVKLDRFAAVHANLGELLKWLALIWFVVALTEELISRAFLIDQWLDLLPVRGRASIALSVALSATTFAAVHYYEGLAGLISNFVAGLIFGALYIFRGRTLGSNTIAHGLADSLGLIAIYFGLAS